MVETLHKQCEDIDSLNYEIIVADDCSTQKQFIEENKKIEQLTHVIYICREHNVGRSAIRNFLVKQAQYDWLLLIDGDLELDNKKFIYNYLTSKGDIVVGGITIGGTKKSGGVTLDGNMKKLVKKHIAWKTERKMHLNCIPTFLLAGKTCLIILLMNAFRNMDMRMCY
jgi:glycosyltransferase involved in cell wall biosynthesis